MLLIQNASYSEVTKIWSVEYISLLERFVRGHTLAFSLYLFKIL